MNQYTDILEYLKEGLGAAMDSLVSTSATYGDDTLDTHLEAAMDILTDCHWFLIEIERAAAALDDRTAIEALN